MGRSSRFSRLLPSRRNSSSCAAHAYAPRGVVRSRARRDLLVELEQPVRGDVDGLRARADAAAGAPYG